MGMNAYLLDKVSKKYCWLGKTYFDTVYNEFHNETNTPEDIEFDVKSAKAVRHFFYNIKFGSDHHIIFGYAQSLAEIAEYKLHIDMSHWYDEIENEYTETPFSFET